MPEKKSQPKQEAEEAAVAALAERKAVLRREMRAKRRTADSEWIIKASERIQKTVVSLPEFAQARAVGCYLALPYEVQTRDIIQTCRDQGKKICVPAFNENLHRYELTWVENEEATRPGRWNIAEPVSINRAGFMDLDLIVVPALAYDQDGNRLGHGGGHYDRILGAWSGIKIGVAFQFQIFSDIPTGSQDIPVDVVVTDQHIYSGSGAHSSFTNPET